MPNTIDQVIDYAKAHPMRDGRSWAGWCESFVWRAGGFNGSFSSALLAGDASGPLNPRWGEAPRGAIHYWAGVGGDGHVAFELGGGTLLMASSRVSNYGTALGTIHFTNYGLPEYRGWSLRHGTQTLARSALAGLDTSLIQGDPDMPRLLKMRQTNDGTNNTETLFFDGGAGVGVKGIGNPYHYALLQRYLSDKDGDHMFPAELAIVNSYLAPATAAPVIDASIVEVAVKAALVGLKVQADNAAIAAAVDTALADNFAAVPGSVVGAIKTAL